jgi:Na+-transporting methylmalonyl-CoA/oxaloacetate decarboxylase gamma subunit
MTDLELAITMIAVGMAGIILLLVLVTVMMQKLKKVLPESMSNHSNAERTFSGSHTFHHDNLID